MHGQEYGGGAETSDNYLDGRLDQLRSQFLAIADGKPPADYIRMGGSVTACLREIELLAGSSEFDMHINASRSAYMDVALTRPTIFNRIARKNSLNETEKTYVDSVVDKISAVVDAHDGLGALAVRQIPTLVEKTSFTDNEPLPLKTFAANHLFVLLDTALQEHAQRREMIRVHADGSLRHRILGNRVLHLTIAGGIFVAAFIPELGIVPTPDEYITQNLQVGLKLLSAGIICIDGPEVVRLKYLQLKHDNRTRELQDELASSQGQTDLALRMVYSQARYGSSKGFDAITNRFGSSNKIENLERFKLLDSTFDNLHGDPGGKPYTGEQAMGYAARFLIERPEQIAAIIDPAVPAVEQKRRYLQLCRDILNEDVNRMKKGLTITRYRKDFMKMVAIVPAMLYPDIIGTVNDASSLGRDTSAVVYKTADANESEE